MTDKKKAPTSAATLTGAEETESAMRADTTSNTQYKAENGSGQAEGITSLVIKHSKKG